MRRLIAAPLIAFTLLVGITGFGVQAASGILSVAHVQATTLLSPWSTGTPVEFPEGHPSSVSCPVPSFCMAVDELGAAFSYNGTSWSAPVLADPDAYTNGYLFAVESVSCVSATFCVAVDDGGNAVVFDGSRWSAPVTIDGGAGKYMAGLESVSCVSTTFCLAVDFGGHAFVFDGSVWTQVSSIGSGVPNVSCVSPTFCLAGAEVFDGSSWALSPNSSEVSGYVSCFSSNFCVAVGGEGEAEVLTSAGWGAPDQFDGVHTPIAVSCWSATSCVAIDSSGNSFAYDGSWSPGARDTQGLVAVSCDPNGVCATLDSGGYAFFQGTESSAAVLVDPPGGNVSSISCPSPSFCAASNSPDGALLTWSDGTWSGLQAVSGLGTAPYVSCSSSTFCVAVDNKGQATMYNGTTWSTPTVIDTAARNALVAISCTPSDFCMAVDQSGNAVIYDGTSWQTPQSVASVSLLAVSCASSSLCAAVDGSSNVHMYSDGVWHTDVVSSENYSLTSVSCSLTSFCVVMAKGDAFTYAGTGGWSGSQTVFASPNGGSPVSCTSSSFCVAVNGTSGTFFDGSAWSDTVQFDPNGGPVLGVSCASTQFCMALDSKNYSFMFSPPSMSVSTTPKNPVVGQSVEVDAKVSGAWSGSGAITPAGSVKVTDGSRSCTAALSGSAGSASASCALAGLSDGSQALVVTYGPNVDFGKSEVSLNLNVTGLASTTTLRLSTSKTTFGHEQAETFSVTTSPNYLGVPPSGKVTVKGSSTTLCSITLSSGKGHCLLSSKALAVGSYRFSAAYSGSSYFSASKSPTVTLSVLKATTRTVLTLSKSSVTYGDENTETLTAAVEPEYAGLTVTGRITVSAGSKVLCVLSASAHSRSFRLSPSRLAAGNYRLVAKYGGNGDLIPSSSAVKALSVLSF